MTDHAVDDGVAQDEEKQNPSLFTTKNSAHAEPAAIAGLLELPYR